MTFAKPEWLLLLFTIPAIAVTGWLAWRRRGDQWKQLVADRLRDRLSQTRPGWTHFVALGLALTGLASLIVAFAQPESGEEWIEIESEGRNILFCIDISRSMLTTDVAPNRLMAARAAALEILEKFPNDRVGVLLFSGNILVQSPLTIDHGFVEQTLAQLTPDDIPTGGSDLTNAVEQGSFILANSGQRSNIMVVFSDGEKSSTGLDAAAEKAAESGIFIYALGFGKDGGFIPDPSQRDGKFRDRTGRPVRSELDEESLKSIAEITDGFYSNGMGRDFLRKLDRALDEMDRFEETGKHQRVAKPAHKWFVLGGFLLLMFSLILRCFPTRAAVMAAAMVVITPQSEAGIFSHSGQEALDRGDYEEAYRSFDEAADEANGDRAAQLHLAAGSAAFQAKDWSPAATSFSKALASSNQDLRQSAHYGLATSLFYLGAPLEGEEQIKAWEGSIKHYEHALEIDPQDEKARENLKAVRTYLEKKQPKQEEQEQEKEEKKQDSEEQNDQEETEDQNQSDSSDENQNEDSEPDENKEDEEKSGEDESKEKQSESEQNKDEQENDGNPDQPEDSNEGDPENEEGENPNDPENKGESENPDEMKEDPGNQESSEDPQPNPDQKEESGEDQPQPNPGEEGEPREGEPKEGQPREGQPREGEATPEDANESPKERARRILRQFSDFGAKPPRRMKTPFRRSAHDW